MKTEDDLLEAIARYSLESTGASEGQIDLMMHRFQTQLMAKLKRKPAKLLTDEEYAEGVSANEERSRSLLTVSYDS